MVEYLRNVIAQVRIEDAHMVDMPLGTEFDLVRTHDGATHETIFEIVMLTPENPPSLADLFKGDEEVEADFEL